jgi:glutamine synthetase
VNAADEISRIVDGWERDGIRYVRFELPDLHGTARTKLVPIGAARAYGADGLNMYGGAAVLDTRSDVVGGTLYNEETKYADQLLFPDPATAAVVPWEEATARFICNATAEDGRPLEASPRQVLARVLDVAAEMGYAVRSGAEYEFYLLNADRTPLFGGWHIFNHVRMQSHPVVRELLDVLPGIGIDFLTANAEYGPGQFELVWGPGLGLAGPDASYTFKNALKEIAAGHGLIATFMSKPFAGVAGCGAHFHVSLIDRDSDAQLMGDDADPQGITGLCRQFVAGNLAYASAIYSLLVPTLNCYKRRRPHTFAPSNISWGLEDRSALVRIKGTSERSRHVEQRAPSGLSNPYLVAAGTLAAGLLGIRDGMELSMEASGPGPAEDDPRHEPLPTDPRASLAALEACDPIVEVLGREFVDAWCSMRRYELQRFDDHVTDWERDEYLEIY